MVMPIRDRQQQGDPGFGLEPTPMEQAIEETVAWCKEVAKGNK